MGPKGRSLVELNLVEAEDETRRDGVAWHTRLPCRLARDWGNLNRWRIFNNHHTSSPESLTQDILLVSFHRLATLLHVMFARQRSEFSFPVASEARPNCEQGERPSR